MKRLIDSYFGAIAAWLDRATERMRQDSRSTGAATKTA